MICVTLQNGRDGLHVPPLVARVSSPEQEGSSIGTSYVNLMPHIMLRDLLTQKCAHKKRLMILDTPEHIDSENIKLKIGSRSWLYQLFSKRDLKVHKMWLNLAKIYRFSNFFGYFHIFQVVEHIPDSFLTKTVKKETFSKILKNSILATFYELKIMF
jgi:hypothetical protein